MGQTTLSVRVDETMQEALQAEVERRKGDSVSELVRRILSEWMLNEQISRIEKTEEEEEVLPEGPPRFLAREFLKVVTREEWDAIPTDKLRSATNDFIPTISKRGMLTDRLVDFEEGERPDIRSFAIATAPSWNVWQGGMRDSAMAKANASIARQESTEFLRLVSESVPMGHGIVCTKLGLLGGFDEAVNLLLQDNMPLHAIICHVQDAGLIRSWLGSGTEEWRKKVVVAPTTLAPRGNFYFLTLPQILGYIIVDDDITSWDSPEPKQLKDGIVCWERVGMCLINIAGTVKVTRA